MKDNSWLILIAALLILGLNIGLLKKKNENLQLEKMILEERVSGLESSMKKIKEVYERKEANYSVDPDSNLEWLFKNNCEDCVH